MLYTGMLYYGMLSTHHTYLQVTVPALLATKAGRVVRRLRAVQGEVSLNL